MPNGLESREPLRDPLAAKGCPGFVVEFNNYSITGDDPMSLTSLLPVSTNKNSIHSKALVLSSKHISVPDQSNRILISICGQDKHDSNYRNLSGI